LAQWAIVDRFRSSNPLRAFVIKKDSSHSIVAWDSPDGSAIFPTISIEDHQSPVYHCPYGIISALADRLHRQRGKSLMFIEEAHSPLSNSSDPVQQGTNPDISVPCCQDGPICSCGQFRTSCWRMKFAEAHTVKSIKPSRTGEPQGSIPILCNRQDRRRRAVAGRPRLVVKLRELKRFGCHGWRWDNQAEACYEEQ